MQNVGNSFSLPFKSANWLSTFLVMGLISLIPIVGALAMTGWMLTLLDNYRQGRTDLPPAGFQHIGRGVNVFVVQLVYGLVLAVLLVGPFVFFIFVGAAAGAGNATGRWRRAQRRAIPLRRAVAALVRRVLAAQPGHLLLHGARGGQHRARRHRCRPQPRADSGPSPPATGATRRWVAC